MAVACAIGGRWRNKRCHDHHREQLYRAPAQETLRSHSATGGIYQKKVKHGRAVDATVYPSEVHFSKAFIGD